MFKKAMAFAALLLIATISPQLALGSGGSPDDARDKTDRSQGGSAIEISNDGGGFVIQYAIQMMRLKEAKTHVRFMGRCDSACTLYLSLPYEQTCITPDAYFRFHSPSAPSANDIEAVRAFMLKKYPRWVLSWISNQGGLTDQLVTMDYAYARRFMRACA
jgi:hypothetical protein